MTDLDHTRAQLAAIPALAAQCGMFLIPSNNQGGDGPRPKPGSRPPVNVALLDLIQGRELWAWCLLIIDERADADNDIDDAPSSRNPSLTEMCEWLAKHSYWIHGLHEDFPASIATIYGEYRRAAGDPQEPTYHCPDCGWTVEPRDGGAWWNCTGCPRTWTMGAEISRLMERQQDVMTLGQISQKLGIPHATLRRWAGKRFASVGTRQGRPLYDIRTVRAASERLKDTA